jgi:Tfp pilus assembly protein PilN
MIRVNLLPQEYRKSEATPLKQFFATVGAVVLAALAATVWAFIYFGSLEPMIKERDDLKQRIADQKAGLDRVKKLDTRVKELKAQYNKIDEVAKNRVVWSRKIDELWEVVVNPKQPNRYEVWLKGLACSLAAGGAKAPVGGSIQFTGVSSGAQVSRMADFHEDLASSECFKDFQKITPPFGLREELPGDNRDPKEGWSFNFTMSLKSLEDMAKEHKAEAEQAVKK